MKQLNIEEIDNLYYYDGKDLGYSFKNNKSIFKFWSPIASSLTLCIYYDYNTQQRKEYEMKKDSKGVWSIEIPEKFEGYYYTFISVIDGNINEGVDPYAKALSVNGEKGAIVNMNNTNPEGFINHKVPKRLYGTDSIIYELSVRDLSSDINSGIKNRRKFLGLSEENTYSTNGTKTGISYIKDLGVTHIQLMPIFDFGSINEEESEDSQYNWGYDPANYNSPEGSYSTNPYNPISRIKELKTAIKTIHENGMFVIMDVVYNHMYDPYKSGFHKLMPGYFFRYYNGHMCNESMCGNAIATENAMVRKFIIDSVKYWVNEYKIDGFRFDLMGLIDIQTMKSIREEMNKIDPNIIIIGEGWNMISILSDDRKSIQWNAYKLKDIGFFNDVARDSIRGNSFSVHEKGFINGGSFKEVDVKKAIVGGVKYSYNLQTWGEVSPNQVVNYIECHDNHTLYDKLKLTTYDDERVKYMHRLGTSIILLSQGIPFIHAGQEFFITKMGVDNSYNYNDSINKLDWLRKSENISNVEYIKGLIKLRKLHPAFRMRTTQEIRGKLIFIDAPASSIAYKLINHANLDSSNEIIVIHNANEENIDIELDEVKKIKVVVDKENAGVEVIKEITTNKISCLGLSTFVGIIN